jgi:type I site-specific restriction endonuclease
MAAETERLLKEKEQLESISLECSDNKTEIERLSQERNAAKAVSEDYSAIVGRQDLLDRKAAIEKAIAGARGSVAEDSAAIEKEISAIEPKLADAREKHGRFDYLSANERRIKELKAEEKKLSKEFEELEKMLFLIETFIKRKVSMLNEKINSKFEIVRFRLFNQLVNGGIEECCVFTINGVPYDGGLNAAARTQGGLDIIRTLQKHYKIAPTVFIDNRESVSEIPGMDCQVVNLIVSPKDKVLRVEAKEGNTLFGRKVA